MTLQSFYRKYSAFLLLAALCIAPGLLYGARGALQNASNDVRQWLPSKFEETQKYDWFLEKFGSEEMVVASWPGCTLDDPRLEQFATGLAPYVEHDNDALPAGESTYFRRVLTGSQVMKQLTDSPLNLSHEEAASRLRGVLLGPDGHTSGAVITVSPTGAANRHAALEVIYAVAAKQAGIAREDLHLGGPTVDSVALDSESGRSRYLLSMLSVFVSLAMAWRCLRQIRLVAIVFGTALLCAVTSVAFVYFSGGVMSLLMVMMPTMVYVLAISAAIHITNHYLNALPKIGPLEAPAHAVAEAWLPCVLSALTTSLGLGSLGLSDVVPVKLFGLYAALGVLASVPIVLLILPAGLQLWPPASGKRRSTKRTSTGTTDNNSERWAAISSFVIRRHKPIVVFGLLIIGFLGAGVLRLETSVKLLNLFSSESRIIQDYTWLEEHLGPLVPVEVVVHFDDKHHVSALEQLKLVTRIEEQITNIEKVGGALSAATFVPSLPEGGGIRRTIQRAMIDRQLRATAADGSQYLQTGDQSQLWRISARVEALNSLDYGIFIGELRDQIEPILQATVVPGVQVTYTGIVPLVYKAQRLLLDDLMKSFVSAFLLIAVVMILMLRGAKAGLVSMLPNLVPAIVIFGGMGWLGRVCDIGSMMTASVAMGIAVDDTIHFLSWFRRSLADGLSRHDAIRMAYQRCAPAMLQSTLICSLGLLMFAFSSFVPTSRFAYMMGSLLVVALIGDLVFLPALLASPLGRFFETAKPENVEVANVLADVPCTETVPAPA